MYKGNNKIQEITLSKSRLNPSVLFQTSYQVIQREIDSYTKALEQDKKKLFRLQESKNQTIKEYKNKVKQLDILKSKQFKTETIKKESRIKHPLEIIRSSKIKKLKDQIDELRKDKNNQNAVFKKLNKKLGELSQLVKIKGEEIKKQKQAIQCSKQQIIKIKLQNENQSKNFREDITNIRACYSYSNSKAILKRKSQIEGSTETIGTQSLIKLRLRNLISKNKVTIKIIDNYKKVMHSIQKSFEQIKEESGINDIEEITNNLIKHEEQNLFVYEYINKLNKQLQELSDYNHQIQAKIIAQKELNKQYKEKLGETPLQQQKIELYHNFIGQSNNKINVFFNFLKLLDPIIKEAKIMFDTQIYELNLNQFTLQQYLSQIEGWISQFYVEQNPTVTILKDYLTNYTKLAPSVNDDIREGKEERVMENQKLREFAVDYWQKRRAKI